MLSHADLAKWCGQIYTRTDPDVRHGEEAWAFFAEFPSELVVSCPGTHVSDFSAWGRDLSAWPAPFYPFWWLHEGFGSGGAALWPDVAQRVTTWKAPMGILPLTTYTGHSLGGALARVLAAYHGNLRPAQRFRVVTFGAPRVALRFNHAFNAALSGALEQPAYERAGDPVPDLPQHWLYQNPHDARVIGKSVTPAGASWLDTWANHSINFYAQDLAGLSKTKG